MAVLTHIDRVPFGAPTPEEIAHDKIAKQHFLEYCDSGKCGYPTKRVVLR